MAQANQSNVRFLIFILEPGVTQHISIHMLPSLLKKLESPELTQLKSSILLMVTLVKATVNLQLIFVSSVSKH